MSPRSSCPLCGGKPIGARPVREMMLGTREIFHLGECERCGTLVLLDPPEDLGSYYPGEYYSFGPPPVRPLPVRLLRRARGLVALRGHERLAAALGGGSAPHWTGWFAIAGLGPGAAVCDLGCGNGELLFDLAAAGVGTAIGADPMIPAPIRRDGVSVERTSATELAAAPGNAGRFNLVMFNHSFEHLEDPLTDLAAARDLLAADGTLMLRVPLTGGLAWRHYGTDWVGLDAPRHLFVPSLAGIEAAAAAAGLEVREVVYDSSELQFWRSEQYRDDVALFEPGSHQVDPKGSPFTKEQITAWRERAEALNDARDGDTAAIFLARAAPDAVVSAPRAAGTAPQTHRPIRVAVAAPDPRDPGGITAVVSAWREAGLGRDDGPVELIELPTSAMDGPLPLKIVQMLAATARLAWLLALRRVDLVHLNASTGGSFSRKLLLARCCRIARIPYVAHMHSGSFEPWLRRTGRNRRRAQALFAHAAITVVLARRWVGVVRQLGAEPIAVLPNGISEAELAALGRARAERRPGSGPVVILFYGRWSPVKGLDVLARALAGLPGENRSAYELRVFGNGDRQWAETVLKPLGASASLRGWLTEDAKPGELAAADVLVAPSRQEGMPMALIEARAAGLSVVASDVGAAAEVLEGYGQARLVPPEDDAALAAALQERITAATAEPTSPDDRPRSPDPVPERFHAEHAVAELERIYADAAAGER